MIGSVWSLSLFSLHAQDAAVGKQVKFLHVQEMSQEEKDLDKTMSNLKELIEKYRETKKAEDLAAVKAKLQVYNQYSLEKHKKRLPEMEKAVDEAKAKLAEDEKGGQGPSLEKQKSTLARMEKELEKAKETIAQEEKGVQMEAMLKAIVDGKFPPARKKTGKLKAQD